MLCEELLAARKLPEIWNDKDSDWETRRKEIINLLQKEVYGYRPEAPEEVTYTSLPLINLYNGFCAGKASVQKIEIRGKLRGKEFAFPFFSAIPKTKEKVPFFVFINFENTMPSIYLPVEEIIDRGFAVFSFGYKDVTDDNGDFSDGLAGVLYGDEDAASDSAGKPVAMRPQGSDCGKIALWSWAASRVMDYCETLDCLDFEKSAVIGHSRLGKTALFTGMLDERFRFTISNDSGCSGAALSRGKQGETVAKICQAFPYWFAPCYADYADREMEMPFDQHFLVAATAPRYVYVASAKEDLWADPVSEYLSCVAAGKLHEQLAADDNTNNDGTRGFVHPDRLPTAPEILQEGSVAYHVRPGAHCLSREDWNYYCDYILSK